MELIIACALACIALLAAELYDLLRVADPLRPGHAAPLATVDPVCAVAVAPEREYDQAA